MTTTKLHSKSGLDRILTANAVSAFTATSFDAHRSDADVRRSARLNAYARALSITDTTAEAIAIFDEAIAWAEEFTADVRAAEIAAQS